MGLFKLQKVTWLVAGLFLLPVGMSARSVSAANKLKGNLILDEECESDPTCQIDSFKVGRFLPQNHNATRMQLSGYRFRLTSPHPRSVKFDIWNLSDADFPSTRLPSNCAVQFQTLLKRSPANI